MIHGRVTWPEPAGLLAVSPARPITTHLTGISGVARTAITLAWGTAREATAVPGWPALRDGS